MNLGGGTSDGNGNLTTVCFTEQRERLQIKDNDENAIADICTSKIGGNSSCATLSDTHVLCIKKVVRDADVIKLGDIDPTPQLALPNAYRFVSMIVMGNVRKMSIIGLDLKTEVRLAEPSSITYNQDFL
ncbi:hypothetical protein Tco_1440859 [Tanacetum coccineum]